MLLNYVTFGFKDVFRTDIQPMNCLDIFRNSYLQAIRLYAAHSVCYILNVEASEDEVMCCTIS